MLSRRQVLGSIVAVTTGVAGGSVLAAGPTKRKPTDVAYQATPNGDQRCSNCTYFSAPYLCAILTTSVAPSGWCTAWQAKQ